jgi:hypothetical protein
VFTSTDEAEQFLGRPWELLGDDPEIGPKLGALDRVLGAEYEDPKAVLRIICKDGTVKVERGSQVPEPDVMLQMTADTGHRFWQGAVNIPMALAKKDVAAVGKMSDVMKVLPFLNPGFDLYKQYLRDQNREDLLGR